MEISMKERKRLRRSLGTRRSRRQGTKAKVRWIEGVKTSRPEKPSVRLERKIREALGVGEFTKPVEKDQIKKTLSDPFGFDAKMRKWEPMQGIKPASDEIIAKAKEIMASAPPRPFEEIPAELPIEVKTEGSRRTYYLCTDGKIRSKPSDLATQLEGKKVRAHNMEEAITLFKKMEAQG